MNHSPLIDTAIVAMLAAAGALAEPIGQDVFGSREIFYTVVLGALGGGYVATTLFTRPDATRRQLAARLVTSSVISMLFSPWLMDVLAIHTTRGSVLGFSAAIAVIGVGCIKGLVAAWTNYFVNRFAPPAYPPAGPGNSYPRNPAEQLPPNNDNNPRP